MKRFALALATLCALVTGVSAQDLVKEPKWTGCYAEAGIGGSQFRALGETMSIATLGLGIGCDYKIMNSIVAGAKVGYTFGREDFRALEFVGRAGVLVNSNMLAYGKLTATLDGMNPKFNEAVYSLGAGVETAIGQSGVMLFLEADTKVGQSDTADRMWSVKGGARVRF